MASGRLIFTDDLIARAQARPEARRSLLQRWAAFPGEERELARRQLEAAASLVPPEKRPRVLQPLHSSDDLQVFTTAGVILLAKVLHDHGWAVEHEPLVDGVTPDLRLRKGEAEFLVEVRQVSGDFGLPSAYQRLEAELRGIQTRTPASFSRMEVDGRASLKGFKAFLRRALDEARPGPQEYREAGVHLCFELHLPPLDSDTNVFFSYFDEGRWFDDRPDVEAALNEKLKKYPFPLIVALQGIETGDMFRAAEDALFGSVAYEIPISHGTGGPAAPARMVRKADSLISRRDASGERARDRLEALLPFEVHVTDRGFAVRARVLANPAKEAVKGIEEFSPMPSLRRLNAETFCYFGLGGRRFGEKEPIADAFYP